MLTIEMLPARHGDCLWIEYGTPEATHRILLDGGVLKTYEVLHKRIEKLKEELQQNDIVFELLVVTHVDLDHIDGIVKLLQDKRLGVKFKDIWFNGWDHVRSSDGDELGPVEGEYLSALLKELRLPWNKAFHGRAVVVPASERLPRRLLDGGLNVVLLSPTPLELENLQDVWEDVVTKACLTPGSTPEALKRLREVRKYRTDDDMLGVKRPDVEKLAEDNFHPDGSESNGSSIAAILEYGGNRVLLGADAHSAILEASLRKYMDEENLARIPLQAFKLAHHGSKANLSRNLLQLLDCGRYLVSTDGSGRQNHPNPETIARILMHGGPRPELIFNFRSEENEIWDDARLCQQHNYKVVYPSAGKKGIRVRL